MNKKYLQGKKRLVAVAAISAILVVCLVGFLQTRPVVEAAMLDPHPGLVGWWRFDEGTGTTATDSSTYGNHGTIYGASWVDGKYGKALDFNGVDNYLEIPDSSSLDITAALTLEAWIFPKSFTFGTYNEGGLISKDLAYRMLVQGNRFSSRFGTTEVMWGDGGRYGPTLPSVNSWYHLVITFNSTIGKVNFYLNGEFSKDEDLTGTINENSRNLVLGHAGIDYFDGIIDEVRIYNRDLSADEIQNNFAKNPDFVSKLLAEVPKGTTKVITTLSWQGIGSVDVTLESPSNDYTEDVMFIYQKTVYSTSNGLSDMLNIKRLSLSVTALAAEENWYVKLNFEDVDTYKITIEVIK